MAITKKGKLNDLTMEHLKETKEQTKLLKSLLKETQVKNNTFKPEKTLKEKINFHFQNSKEDPQILLRGETAFEQMKENNNYKKRLLNLIEKYETKGSDK